MLKKARNRQIEGFTKEDEGTWTGPYVFIHGADPQLGFIDKVKGRGAGKWDEEVRLFKEAVAAINKMSPKPRFFFISGDLVDAFPYEEPLHSEQKKDIFKILSECHIPTMVISGNHDIGNSPAESSIAKYREDFGDDFYSFYVGGVFYIALNSQYFYDSSKAPKMAQEQMDWLDDQLNSVKENRQCKHVIIFMHIPIFISDGDEDNQYFSIPQPLRATLLGKFCEAGVETVFSGHYHRNAGGVWTTTVNGRKVEIRSVVTSAIGAQLGKDKSGLGVVKVEEESVKQTYYAMNEIPESSI